MNNDLPKISTVLTDIDLGDITESKKLSLLDEVGTIVTQRIILTLINQTPEDRREKFIEKINKNADEPSKLLLFIDHFVDNADDVISTEIEKCKEELAAISKK